MTNEESACLQGPVQGGLSEASEPKSPNFVLYESPGVFAVAGDAGLDPLRFSSPMEAGLAPPHDRKLSDLPF